MLKVMLPIVQLENAVHGTLFSTLLLVLDAAITNPPPPPLGLFSATTLLSSVLRSKFGTS